MKIQYREILIVLAVIGVIYFITKKKPITDTVLTNDHPLSYVYVP